MSKTQTISAPEWEALHQMNIVCDALRRNEITNNLPRPIPRRFKTCGTQAPAEYDSGKIVYLKFASHFSAKVTMGCLEDPSGPCWYVTDVFIRLKRHVVGHGCLGSMSLAQKIEIKLDARQADAVGRGNKEAIERAVAPIRAAVEQRVIWEETNDAYLEKRSFSWLPGFEPAISIPPPSEPPLWVEDLSEGQLRAYLDRGNDFYNN